jgi:UDP-N-acetyl-D-mannosaminuronate dehydrogenase
VPLRLIPAARAVNDGMPGYVAEILVKALAEHGVEPHAARVLLLGYAYLEDSDDTRNSPSAVLVDQLTAQGIEVRVHDPFVEDYSRDPYILAESCHALVVIVGIHFIKTWI